MSFLVVVIVYKSQLSFKTISSVDDNKCFQKINMRNNNKKKIQYFFNKFKIK